MKIPRTFRIVLISALALLLHTAPTVHAQPNSPKPPMCTMKCLDEYDPVCGDNGALYSNECYLRVAACLLPGEVGSEPVRLPSGELDLSCEQPIETPPGEEPIGGTAGWDDSWPLLGGEDTIHPNSSSSSSSSTDGDSDDDDDDSNDDDPGYQLPPNVVIDDNAPSAEDFIPVTPAPTAPGPVLVLDDDDSGSGGEDVIGGTTDLGLDEDVIGDTTDLGLDEEPVGGTADVDFDEEPIGGMGDLGFAESAKWEAGSVSSASSDSGDNGGSGDGEEDHDGSNGGSDALCEIMCAEVFDPVCASNSVTYNNRCKLTVAQCQDPSVKLLHMGMCGSASLSPDPCAFECPMLDAPVCSADGHIYTNRCTYDSSRCRDPTLAEATEELCVRNQ